MASANGLLNNNLVVNTLDGLTTVYTSGGAIDPTLYVKYADNTNNTDLGTFDLQTLGSISAKQHVLPLFGSTIMTSPTTSSIFYAHSWKLNNTVGISSLGAGNYLSTSYLTIRDVTNASTLLTLQSDGIADFADTRVRVSTMATNPYDVINLSTLTSAVAFIENVNALNYVPYTNALQDLNMMGSTITTLGQINAGTLSITSVANADYTLSVNPYDQLEFTNLSNGSIFKTNGSDLFVTGSVSAGTLGATNVEAGSNIYLAKTSVAEWRTTLGPSDQYEILDNAGVRRLQLSKTGGLVVSTLTVSQVPSATPSLAIGVNGSGGFVSFAVPTTTGFVPYVGATASLQLGSNNLIANTARFTGVVSATPSLALGVDGSGNLNTFAVPSATNLLPLNNTWSGTNTFNNTVQVSGVGVNLGVSLGSIIKTTATAGSLVQITGGGATSSPYLEFFFGGNSRGYIGNASAVDLDLVAQNGTKLNFYTAGTKRMEISTTGAITVPNDIFANNIVINGGGSYVAGCIYSDANWGMLFRAKVVPSAGGGIFLWNDSAGAQKMKMLPSGVLELNTPSGGPGFVQTNGTIIVETYLGGSGGGGWFGTRSNHPLLFYANNSSARMTIEPSLGYVAIGNFTPSYKLHVGGADGNIRAEGSVYCDRYLGTNSALRIDFDAGQSVNWVTNNTGSKPIQFGPGSWANNGYTVISQSQTVNGPGLGLGSSSYGGGSRGVVISLSPGVAWGEMILAGATIYTACFGTPNNYTNGGGWVYISDRRCKKDIKDIKTARSLERIMALKPKTYKKIYPEISDTPAPQSVRDKDHIGFIAQDVMDTNPHCVDEWVDDNAVCDGDDGKRLGISYGDINVHMVGAIQELKKQNDAQQKEIDDLKEMVKVLIAKIK